MPSHRRKLLRPPTSSTGKLSRRPYPPKRVYSAVHGPTPRNVQPTQPGHEARIGYRLQGFQIEAVMDECARELDDRLALVSAKSEGPEGIVAAPAELFGMRQHTDSRGAAPEGSPIPLSQPVQ